MRSSIAKTISKKQSTNIESDMPFNPSGFTIFFNQENGLPSYFGFNIYDLVADI